MTKLIHTRRGALLYAAAAPLLALLLCLLLAVSPASTSTLVSLPPVFLFLAVWMAFGLCAWGLLIRWAVRRLIARRGTGLATCLLALPLAMLMWFPAGIGGPFLYLWSLVCLARGRYPDIPWSPLQRRRTLAVTAVILLLLTAQAISGILEQRTPAATPEEAYRRSVNTAMLIDQLPQEDGSILMIGFGSCAVVEEQENGWAVREVYSATQQLLTDDSNSFHASICRNPSGETDVVTVWKAVFAGDTSSRGSTPPRDSAGSDFICVTDENPLVTSYYYYALADADADGYELFLE